MDASGRAAGSPFTKSTRSCAPKLRPLVVGRGELPGAAAGTVGSRGETKAILRGWVGGGAGKRVPGKVARDRALPPRLVWASPRPAPAGPNFSATHRQRRPSRLPALRPASARFKSLLRAGTLTSRAMAVYLGMLRVVRLCAGRPEVLGAGGGLSRVWQEARLWGVRPLRYAAPGREGTGQSPGWGSWAGGGGGGAVCRASQGADGTQAGRLAAAAPLGSTGERAGTLNLAPRQQEMLAWPTQAGAAAAGTLHRLWVLVQDSRFFQSRAY